MSGSIVSSLPVSRAASSPRSADSHGAPTHRHRRFPVRRRRDPAEAATWSWTRRLANQRNPLAHDRNETTRRLPLPLPCSPRSLSETQVVFLLAGSLFLVISGGRDVVGTRLVKSSLSVASKNSTGRGIDRPKRHFAKKKTFSCVGREIL